jgi:hypothetical protein
MAIFNVEAIKKAPLRSVVDEGWYLVEITKAATGESKQKHTPSIDIDYSVSAAPEQLDGRDCTGHRIFQHIYFSDKNSDVSARTMKQLCKAAGVELDSEEQILEDLVGKELKIQIKHREYQGEIQEEVKSYKGA